ncbi:MAG: pilus assembly protein TadG-related protein [Pseudomonadota bacterium]|nr:MAG: hypothetical protein DIU72_01680 [Pseudomonadota bacterium]
MVLSAIRRLAQEEDGQALVLGALLMLVVALAVLSVSSLGRTLYEEIRLQNAADNAAYSLAAQQARAFNFYAYANRAQIAHYVTILQLLSANAIVLGLVSGLGTLSALLETAASVCDGPKQPLCKAIPVVGPALVTLATLAKALAGVVRTAARALLEVGRWIGRVGVPLLVAANLFLFASQAAMLAATLARFRDEEVLRVARGTAPGARLAFAEATFAANARRFLQAHLEEAMTLWGTGDPVGARLEDGPAGRRNWARRGMSELVHASRQDSLVYDRTFPGTGIGGLPGISALRALFDVFAGARFRGHTRLHSTAEPGQGTASARRYYEQMEKPGYGTARYPTGNSVGANFYLEVPAIPDWLAEPLGIGRRELGSVTATGTQGFACAWDLDRPYREMPAGAIEIHVPRFRCDLGRGDFPWWGIGPFMHFDATRDDCGSPESDFCQPDVWVALRGGEDEKATEREAAILRAAGSGDPLPEEGRIAVARALAYYHRPGTWREPPNFFNPHWRAKLAPVEEGWRHVGQQSPDLARALATLLGREEVRR